MGEFMSTDKICNLLMRQLELRDRLIDEMRSELNFYRTNLHPPLLPHAFRDIASATTMTSATQNELSNHTKVVDLVNVDISSPQLEKDHSISGMQQPMASSPLLHQTPPAIQKVLPLLSPRFPSGNILRHLSVSPASASSSHSSLQQIRGKSKRSFERHPPSETIHEHEQNDRREDDVEADENARVGIGLMNSQPPVHDSPASIPLLRLLHPQQHQDQHPSPTRQPETSSAAMKRAKQSATATSTNNPIKYVETVRSKHDRSKLHAHDCPCCSRYFDYTAKYLLDPAPPANTGDPIKDRQARQDYDRLKREAVQRRKQMSSRHRVVSERPKTPEGFWELGFSEQVKRARPPSRH